MNLSTINIFLLISCFLLCCEPSIKKEEKLSSTIDSSTASSYDPPEPPTKNPGEIDFNIFSKQDIILQDPFNPTEALHKLYHGDTIKDEWDEYGYPFLEIWKCDNCSQKKFEGTIIGDTILFPAPNGNDTRILNVYDFEDAEKNKFKIMATTSSEFSPYHERVGRYCCGILGLSLFQKKENAWKLIAFNPALGCFGMFQKVNKPEIIPDKYTFLLLLNNIVGGPAEPYWGDLSIIGLYNKEFKILLKESFTYRSGTFEGNPSWNTEVKIEHCENLFPKNIQLIIAGDFNYEKFIENDTISNLPKILRDKVKSGDDFLFEIKREYEFKKSNYIFSNERLMTKEKK